MKLSNTFVIILLLAGIGIAILAMQKPITKAITGQNEMTSVKISQIWDLPQELNEISGIAWLDGNTFACVQDEDGFIFIYNLDENKITDKIEFAGNGDYEGIAINGENAYIMRSDGVVYEVQDFKTSHKKVEEFKTQFTDKNNIESLTFDAKNKRLLTAPKDKGLKKDSYKGVYQIPLDQKAMDITPIVKIDMNEKAFDSFKNKKIHKTFNPSDIAIHPKTNAMYVLDGKNPKFLVLKSSGELVSVQPLDENKFPQPEGITFSDDGRLFISNEANDGPATIVEINTN